MCLEWDLKKYSAAIFRRSFLGNCNQNFTKFNENSKNIEYSIESSTAKYGFGTNCGGYLHEISDIAQVKLENLIGIEPQKAALLANTKSFLENNLGANALLWGARGCGKSSLVKAMLCKFAPLGLKMLQVLKSELCFLPEIFDFLRSKPYKIIVFLDDLSFEENESEYKILKTILDGGIEESPRNIRIYATSNRRHLLPEYHNENEIFGSQGNEDKIALSDRFALNLGFYAMGANEFLALVAQNLGLLDSINANLTQDSMDFIESLRQNEKYKNIFQNALNYAALRGSRSARIAEQFCNLYKSGICF